MEVMGEAEAKVALEQVVVATAEVGPGILVSSGRTSCTARYEMSRSTVEAQAVRLAVEALQEVPTDKETVVAATEVEELVVARWEAAETAVANKEEELLAEAAEAEVVTALAVKATATTEAHRVVAPTAAAAWVAVEMAGAKTAVVAVGLVATAEEAKVEAAEVATKVEGRVVMPVSPVAREAAEARVE